MASFELNEIGRTASHGPAQPAAQICGDRENHGDDSVRTISDRQTTESFITCGGGLSILEDAGRPIARTSAPKPSGVSTSAGR